MAELTDDAANGRFEMTEQGAVVFAEYRRDGAKLIIDHVETPDALRGHGAAGRLMAAIADKAKGEHLTIVPICGYAAAWLERHPAAAG
jgi:uncharacterized protein